MTLLKISKKKIHQNRLTLKICKKIEDIFQFEFVFYEETDKHLIFQENFKFQKYFYSKYVKK